MLADLGVFVPGTVFQQLPEIAQQALIAALRGATAGAEGPAVPRPPDSGETEGLADLSPMQARKFVEGCGDRIRNAVRTIAENGSRFFTLAVVAKALKVGPEDLTGVWAGITKRTRTVLGDREAKLIAWGDEEYENEEYVDQPASISETTYRSLRKVFSIA